MAFDSIIPLQITVVVRHWQKTRVCHMPVGQCHHVPVTQGMQSASTMSHQSTGIPLTEPLTPGRASGDAPMPLELLHLLFHRDLVSTFTA